MASHDQLMMAQVKTEVNEAEEDGRTLEQTEVKTEVKIEVDVAEEDWRTLDQSGQGNTHDWSESNTTDTHHETDTQTLEAVNIKREPVTESDTCQWIKTEPVEENETSDVFHQFQSEPVDKSERKWDITRESLTGVGLSCVHMSSGTTANFEQPQFTSGKYPLKMKRDPCICSESNIMNTSSVIKTETVVSSKDFRVGKIHISDIVIRKGPFETRLTAPPPVVSMESERLSGQGCAHYPTKIPYTGKKKCPQKLCQCCSFPDKTGGKKYLRRKDTTYECLKCGVGLCIDPCFRIYHEYKDYQPVVKQILGLNL